MGLKLQFGEQFIDGEFVVSGHGFQDAAEQRAGFQRAMIRDRQMMGPAQRGCQSDVGAVLSHRLVAEHPQGADEFGRADIAGDFHTAKASSRTKWRRMIFGIEPGAPSPK